MKCFLCEGSHMARDCPKRSKLLAPIESKDEQPRPYEETKMGSLQILNAIKAKVKIPRSEKKGQLYVTTKVGGHEVQALVDTRVTHNFLEVKEADRLGIKYEKEQGWLKAVNSEPKLVFGVACEVKVCLGEWFGLMDFSIVPMDDYPIVLGMEFMD